MTETTEALGGLFSDIAHDFDNHGPGVAYAKRHRIASASILTVQTDEMAGLITEHLAPRIAGRTVVEIGGGFGLLSLHMANVAARVFCVEANPLWSSVFVELLLERKPANLSFLFGTAAEFVGHIRGDVALFCTHSGVAAMTAAAQALAPSVIDVYGEMVDERPEAFDPFARQARKLA